MRKIPIFLVLVLTAIWTYTSWYWYTCTIKGFCHVETLQELDIPEKTLSQAEKEVLLWNTARISETQTGTIVETGSTTQETLETPVREDPNVMMVKQECADIVSKAISLWASNNDETEVSALEKFLNETQWETLEINGKYNQQDYEAIKRFQQKYRKDILDPWQIESPTGYVYTTTIKKINDINCNK